MLDEIAYYLFDRHGRREQPDSQSLAHRSRLVTQDCEEVFTTA
jgi:hypothetical protein